MVELDVVTLEALAQRSASELLRDVRTRELPTSEAIHAHVHRRAVRRRRGSVAVVAAVAVATCARAAVAHRRTGNA